MVIVACLFVALICVLAATGELPVAAAVLHVAASLTAFLLYRIDKAAAVSGARRTPESTLLAVGLFGGWPGALVAQQVLRHKSRKTSFQILFWITVVSDCAAMAWLWSVT